MPPTCRLGLLLPVEQTGDRTRHARRHRAGQDGLQTQVCDFQPSFGDDGSNAANHDAEAGKVSEPADAICHDDCAAFAQTAGRELRHLDVCHEFVENHLGAEQLSGGH